MRSTASPDTLVRLIIFAALGPAVIPSAIRAAEGDQHSPNIVVILSDDQ
jgi:hypothetical protein